MSHSPGGVRQRTVVADYSGELEQLAADVLRQRSRELGAEVSSRTTVCSPRRHLEQLASSRGGVDDHHAVLDARGEPSELELAGDGLDDAVAGRDLDVDLPPLASHEDGGHGRMLAT